MDKAPEGGFHQKKSRYQIPCESPKTKLNEAGKAALSRRILSRRQKKRSSLSVYQRWLMSGSHVIEDKVFKKQRHLSDAFCRKRRANQDEKNGVPKTLMANVGKMIPQKNQNTRLEGS